MSDALTILQDHKPASSMRSNSSKPCAIRGRGLCGAIHNGEPVPASGKLQKGCGIYPVEVAPSPHRETVQENCMQNILGIFSSRAAAEEAVQHASDHGSHLRNGQCGGQDFFPAWSPA